jgi:hypothetical protein
VEKMKKIIISCIFFVILLATCFSPILVNHSIGGIMGGPKKYTGGSFSGWAAVSDDASPYEGQISANAYNRIICTAYNVGSVVCKAPYTVETKKLFGGADVRYELWLGFPNNPHSDDRIIPMSQPNDIKRGTLEALHNLVPFTPIEIVNVNVEGTLYINDENFGHNTHNGQATIIKTLLEFLEDILDWLDFPVCYLEGSRVTMADGSYKNIEDIAIGDSVLSYDINGDTVTPSIVTEVFVHSPDEMMDHYLLINDEISVTPNHMLLINDVLTPAGCAEIGDIMKKSDESVITIESIDKIYSKVTTYNFHIDDQDHLYIIEDILALPLKINAVATEGSETVEISEVTWEQEFGWQQSQNFP